MKYNVYIYAVAVVPVKDIEADCQQAAIKRAIGQTNLTDVIRNGVYKIGGDYAEEIVEYLVDEVGDEQYANSVRYMDGHFKDGFINDGTPSETFRYDDDHSAAT